MPNLTIKNYTLLYNVSLEKERPKIQYDKPDLVMGVFLKTIKKSVKEISKIAILLISNSYNFQHILVDNLD